MTEKVKVGFQKDDEQKLEDIDDTEKIRNNPSRVTDKGPEDKESKDAQIMTNELSEQEKYIMKLSQPNCLTKIIVNCPFCLLAVSILVMFFISVFVQRRGWILPND